MVHLFGSSMVTQLFQKQVLGLWAQVWLERSWAFIYLLVRSVWLRCQLTDQALELVCVRLTQVSSGLRDQNRPQAQCCAPSAQVWLVRSIMSSSLGLVVRCRSISCCYQVKSEQGPRPSAVHLVPRYGQIVSIAEVNRDELAVLQQGSSSSCTWSTKHYYVVVVVHCLLRSQQQSRR